MMKYCKYLVLLSVIVVAMYGCGPKAPCTLVPDYASRGVRMVAVMPVNTTDGDERAARAIRSEVQSQLYFKGYAKVPLALVDRSIKEFSGTNPGGTAVSMSPQTMGDLLGVDAVMYCTIAQWDTSPVYLYAPTSVTARFELKSAVTGEMLWHSEYTAVERNYDITGKRLEMKSYEAYERIVAEVVTETLSTLPNGPDYLPDMDHEQDLWPLW